MLTDQLLKQYKEFIKEIPHPESEARLIVNENDNAKKFFFTLLNFWNVLDIEQVADQYLIKARSRPAYGFLQSYRLYIEEGFPLVTSWEETLGQNEENIKNKLDWGLSLLREMELKRFEKFRSYKHLDKRKLVLLMIKAEIEGETDPQFLLQYSLYTRAYQMIGGYSSDQYEGEEEALYQLNNDLPFNYFTSESVQLTPLLSGVTFRDVARVTGLLTEYEIYFYGVQFTGNSISLTSKDQWFSLEELNRGESLDGEKVRWPRALSSLDRVNSMLLNAPVSFSVKQTKRSKPEMENAEKFTTPIDEEIFNDKESDVLEFKSSLRWDYRQNKVNKDLEKTVCKSICGFLNTAGGTLIIGLSDEGNVIGIDQEMSSLQKKNQDGYYQHLTGLITSYIGLEFMPYIKIDFSQTRSKTLCVIRIIKASEPVFLKDKEFSFFYIRAGNSTRQLDSESTYKYILRTWTF